MWRWWRWRSPVWYFCTSPWSPPWRQYSVSASPNVLLGKPTHHSVLDKLTQQTSQLCCTCSDVLPLPNERYASLWMLLASEQVSVAIPTTAAGTRRFVQKYSNTLSLSSSLLCDLQLLHLEFVTVSAVCRDFNSKILHITWHNTSQTDPRHKITCTVHVLMTRKTG